MIETQTNDLPRFADAGSVVGESLALLRFPKRIAVSAAAKHRRKGRILLNPGAFSGPWAESPHDMRFMDRAMDALGSDSPYSEVGIMGPAQTGKSEIGNNWLLHTILYDPADMLFVMPDKESVRSYVTTQINKMLDAQPLLRARQLGGPSADNITLKQFLGCDIHILHPSGSTFRARPVARGRVDDLDQFDIDIADQGSLVGLLKGRMASFDAFGSIKVYVNSSPMRGPKAGIEAFVAGGTNERWWVDCLHCDLPFEMDSDKCLSFDREKSAEEAAATVELICPECGGSHRQRDKRALMARGRWVARGQTAVSFAHDSAGVVGDLPATRRLTQRWDGLMGMRSWANIAFEWRNAEIAYEEQQDEGPLKTVYQTVIGKNYTPRSQGEPPVTEDDLRRRARASGYVLGEVPPGVICLIASIDQQVNRFEVSVWGFGVGFRAWLVDRYALMFTDEDGRERPLRPFTRLEDWSAIHSKVLSQTYPLAGMPQLRMKIFNTAVDTGGLDNATDNAFAWWYAMIGGDAVSGRAPLPPTAITLVKGGNNPNARLLPPPTIDARRQVKGLPQAEMYVPNVSRLKDIQDTRLKRSSDGPGFVQLPSDIDDKHIAELRAEQKIGDQWVRDRDRPNETWDLYNYAFTVILRFGGGDASMRWVPAWARPPVERPIPALSVSNDEVDRVESQQVALPARPAASKTAQTVLPPRPIAKRTVRVQRAR